MALSLKEKVASCYGQMNLRSAARVCGCSQSYVRHVWGLTDDIVGRQSKYDKYGRLKTRA